MAEIPESVKKLKEEAEFYRDKYFTFDLPFPICGLTAYPVPVKYYNEFLSSSACFTLNKNDTRQGIRQTHLDFLISKLSDEKDGALWSMRFSRLFELCFHTPMGMTCPSCGKFLSYQEFLAQLQKSMGEADAKLTQCECGATFVPTLFYEKDKEKNTTILNVNGVKITPSDFSKLRKMIMYQNLPDYKDDEWVDKAVRDDQAAKQELQARNKGQATLERKIIGVVSNTNYTLEQVYEMPMRKFIQLLGMIDDMINYQTTKTGLMSGMVSFKKGQTIDHWLYKKDEGMYGKAMDADTYRSQIEQNN